MNSNHDRCTPGATSISFNTNVSAGRLCACTLYTTAIQCRPISSHIELFTIHIRTTGAPASTSRATLRRNKSNGCIRMPPILVRASVLALVRFAVRVSTLQSRVSSLPLINCEPFTGYDFEVAQSGAMCATRANVCCDADSAICNAGTSNQSPAAQRIELTATAATIPQELPI